ncbi:glyoxalase [Rhodanobacter panaciterrae]|uniref:Glyoxalase n=1 Tax=Rhodanobacter panaciterrae TaxID=490572 RepID=A0ABQ2ZPF7_9GAMM|nr:VOC family protein [Rhodanobacter panaciterrae]GGY20781.1 glyoxalase [Rhodanobacter panaciterrae]
MRKSILSILAGGLLLALASMSFSSYAANVHDNDYVSIGVPDLPQATAFFRNILDCEPVNPVAGSESPESTRAGHATRDALPPSRLLLCDSGTVVELFDAHGMHFPTPARHATDHGSEPITFAADNVAHADRWLRHEGIQVIGAPVTMTSGPHAGRTVVNFVAPWGLRLQLVGRTPSQIATAP